MRIKDIITEAPRTGAQTVARQRVSPELLNMIANKSQYEKELAAVKAAQPKDKKDQSQNDDLIKVRDLKLRKADVQHWAETHDKNFIYDKSKKWFNHNMPAELMTMASQDPEWKSAVEGVWDIAVKYLQAKETPVDVPVQGHWNYPTRELARKVQTTRAQRAGLDLPKSTDAGGIVDLQRQIRYAIEKYLPKFGIDKHGRRLPGR